MKLTAIITCLFFVMTSSVLEAKPKRPEIHVISKRLDIFYFKVQKEVIGAEIEVYSESGDKLMQDTITEKRTLIDFYYENPGHYIIKIKKGDVVQSFDYYKNTDSPFTSIETPHVTIARR
jgi:hypothetical protein